MPEDITNGIEEKINNEVKLIINSKIEQEYIETVVREIILSNSKGYDLLMDKGINELLNKKV